MSKTQAAQSNRSASEKNQKDEPHTTAVVSPNAYDAVQYESHCYPDTHPAHMAGIAAVFGLKTPPLDRCRVLELGCAAGGNIMPLACDFPESAFVGIDLSSAQIEEGKSHIQALGLKNIELHHMDIMDVRTKLGQFDYIVCHGVFSWVPDSVRHAILDICQNNLTPEGLAVISYNVMPGWSVVRSIRDMMLYHTNRFAKPEEKIQQARLFMDFLYDNTPESSTYKKVLESERNILRNANDSYVAHEYLEDVNQQFYFHEFAAMLGQHDLSYVGDASLTSMFAGNLPPAAFEKLRAVSDLVLQEQYMDFIRNRRFRHSIVTHKSRDSEIRRKVEADTIFNFRLISNLTPIDASEVSDVDKPKIADGQRAFKNTQTGKQLFTRDRALIALIEHLDTYKGRSVPFEAAIKATAKASGVGEDLIRQSIRANGMHLVFSGVWGLTLDTPRHTTTLSEKPEAYAIARYQAGLPGCKWVTSAKKTTCRVDAVSVLILPLLDGKTPSKDIPERVVKFMEERNLSLNVGNVPVTGREERIKTVGKLTNDYLQRFLENGVLVA